MNFDVQTFIETLAIIGTLVRVYTNINVKLENFSLRIRQLELTIYHRHNKFDVVD